MEMNYIIPTLGGLKVFQGRAFFIAELPEESWCEAGHFFELAGQMGHTAVMELVGDLRQVELIIQQQLFYPFDLMNDNELLYGDPFYFRENIGQVSIIVI